MRLLPLLALGCAACLVTGCAVTPPVALTPLASTTAAAPGTSPVATPDETPSTTPSVSAPAQPTRTPSASPPATRSVVLSATGIGAYRIGTPEATVLGFLSARLGKPDDSFSGPVCELDPNTPYGRQVGYGAAFLIFESAPKKGSNAPRKLAGWIVQTEEPLKAPLALAAGLPQAPTYAELSQQFPGGKLEELPIGAESFWLFTTPSGVWYRGEDKSAPDQIGAGQQRACE